MQTSPPVRPMNREISKQSDIAGQEGQQGSALIVVVILLTVASMLGNWAFNSAQHSASAAMVTGKQVDATAAADAGLNLAVQTIGGSEPTTLPCGPTAVSGTLGTVPAQASYSVSITYYPVYPPDDSILSCDQLAAGDAIPAAALITSEGTTTSTVYGNEAMQALVQLNPVPGGGFNSAIFANGTLSFSNQATINGQPGQGSNANVYSNQSMTCANNEVIHGSAIVQGTFDATNRCSVDDTVYASGNVAFSNSGTVGGDIKSSRGSISLSNTNIVDGSAIAEGTVSMEDQATVLGNIVQDAVIPDPPYQAFPSFTFSSTDWGAAGFTTLVTDDDCNKNDPVNVYNDISSMSSATSPTVIETSCSIVWSNNSSLVLGSSLAVISTGGFSSMNRLIVSPAGSSPEDLYLVVPSSVTCSGSTGAISFANNTSISPDVHLFLYSPCNVAFSNNQGTFGQVYAGGNVSIANLFSLTYIPMALPSVSGIGNPLAFQTNIVYERQVAPGN